MMLDRERIRDAMRQSRMSMPRHGTAWHGMAATWENEESQAMLRNLCSDEVTGRGPRVRGGAMDGRTFLTTSFLHTRYLPNRRRTLDQTFR